MAVYLFHQISDRWSISIYFDGTNDSYFLFWLQKEIYSRILDTRLNRKSVRRDSSIVDESSSAANQMRVFVVPVEHSDALVSPAGAEHVTIDRVGVDAVDLAAVVAAFAAVGAGCWFVGCRCCSCRCWLLVWCGCWLLVADYWVLAPACWLLAPACWFLVPSCWLLGLGSWPLAPGCLLAGNWLLTVGFSLLASSE